MVYTANHAVIVHHIFTPWLDVILRETQTHDKDADRRIIILYHTRVRSLSSFITVLLSKIFSTEISDYIFKVNKRNNFFRQIATQVGLLFLLPKYIINFSPPPNLLVGRVAQSV